MNGYNRNIVIIILNRIKTYKFTRKPLNRKNHKQRKRNLPYKKLVEEEKDVNGYNRKIVIIIVNRIKTYKFKRKTQSGKNCKQRKRNLPYKKLVRKM